jgi:glycosyltransferase involved in cell wall biosynthesis
MITGIWAGLIAAYLVLYAIMILRFVKGWNLFLQSKSGECTVKAAELLSGEDMDGREISWSVVVAARNESKRIGPLLEALSSQNLEEEFTGHWEVVVVDDESTDGTAALVESFAKEHPELILRLIRRNGADSFPRHKKGAVALGVSAAKGDRILVTDADCVPGSGWCRAMIACLANGSAVEFVAGPVRLYPCKSVWLQSQALEFMGLNAIAASSIALGQPIISNGGNMAFRRSTFQDLHPYADNMEHPGGDDDLLMHRVVQAYGSASVVFCADPLARVDTPPVEAVRDFLQQRIRWISKQSAYPSPWVSGILKAVWLMQVLIFAGLWGGFLVDGMIVWISCGGWFIKGWLDGLFTRQAAGFYGVRAPWWLFVITHLWYLPYTLYAGLMGYRGQFEWKGRAYRT